MHIFETHVFLLNYNRTNYFYGKNIVYGVNGGNHDTEDTTSGFHTYTIDW